MNPYQYQQQQQLQYQQQYGQQAVQYIPYPYNVAQQPTAVMGQYGGAYAAYPSQTNAAVGQTVGNVPQNQMTTSGIQAYGTYPVTQNVNQAAFQTTQYQTQPAIASSDQTTSQTATTTNLLPQMPAFPAMPSIADINQQYNEQYQKWQQQYLEWQAQHANHPDQKLFQEYQKQVQQWQQQQQQLLTVQSAQVPMVQQPVPFGRSGTDSVENKEPLQAEVPPQGAPSTHYMQANSLGPANAPSQATQQETNQQQNQPTPQQLLQNVTNKGQDSNNQYGGHGKQWNQNTNNIQPDKGQNFSKQHGGNTQNNISQWNQSNKGDHSNKLFGSNAHYNEQWSHNRNNKGQDSSKQFGGNRHGNMPQWSQPINDLQRNQVTPNRGTSNQVTPNRGTPNQVTPNQGTSNQVTPNLGTTNQVTPNRGTSNQMTPNRGTTNQVTPNRGTPNQVTPNQGTSNQVTPNRGTTNQMTPNRGTSNQMTPNRGTTNQVTPNRGTTNQGDPNQGTTNQVTPNRDTQRNTFGLQGQQQQKLPPNNQGFQGKNTKPQPNWLKDKPLESNKTVDSTKLVPKWLQASENQAKNQQTKEQVSNASKTTPKWLQTEAKPATTYASTPGEVKPLPKWLQDTRSSVQEKSKLQNQQMLNQQSQPPPTQPHSQQPKEAKPIPKWLQETKVTTCQQSTCTSTTTTSTSLSSQPVPSTSDLISSTNLSALVTSTSSTSTFSPQKLDLKEEIELLQKQSLQLLQLAQFEKQQKESKPESSQAQPTPVLPSSSQTPSHPVEAGQTHEQIPIQPTPQQPKDLTNNRPSTPMPFLKTIPCKFFPNCRNGVDCKFKHPPCSRGESCTAVDCIFDHINLPENNSAKHPVTETADITTTEDTVPGLSGDFKTEQYPDANREQPLKDEAPPSHEYGPSDEKREWYPESRGEEGYREQWRDEGDWQQWRKEWPREPRDPRDERPPSPRGRAEPHWDERPYPRGGDDWNWEYDRYRSQQDDWVEPPPDYRREQPDRYENERWSAPSGYEREQYEEDRWRRPPGDWDYQEFRDDRRPPLPRYQRKMEYDQERPYDREEERHYDDYPRHYRPRSPADYDRREWEERDRDYYDRPPPRDPEWRDRRGPPDRYPDDYQHPDRWTLPRDSQRDPRYDGDVRYRDGETDRWEGRDVDRGTEPDHRQPLWDGPNDQKVDRYEDTPRDIPLAEKKKAIVVPVETILDKPGRDTRPDRFVIILRGLPGSGKTHVARLIKDKEVSNGAHAPRIIGLDDYFLTEVEKQENDPDTGKKVKKKVMEYVFEEEMEETYMASMYKSFTKTLEDGFFPVIMVDAINNKVQHFEKYWSFAKQKGFEVYIAELSADAHVCAKRNSHQRSFADISKMLNEWEEIPSHMLRLDVRALLQDAIITEVEMEAADETPTTDPAQESSRTETKEENEEDDFEQSESGIQILLPQKSKWDDVDSSAEAQLNKLDGIRPLKRRREASPVPSLSDDEDPYDEKEEDMRIGKKRVRWADLEERKHMEHRRRIGFCIGTDWSLLTDPHAKIPEH